MQERTVIDEIERGDDTPAITFLVVQDVLWSIYVRKRTYMYLKNILEAELKG